jgi:hypothetical protein
VAINPRVMCCTCDEILLYRLRIGLRHSLYLNPPTQFCNLFFHFTYYISSDIASILEYSGSRPYVKLIFLAHLAMLCGKQGSVVGNQITDIIVLSKGNTIRL